MLGELTALCLAANGLALPHDLWRAWSLAPATLLPLLALLAWLMVRRRQAGPLLGGCLVCVALVSPLCRLAATLAWAHMAQLMLLLAAAALLAGPAAHGHSQRPGPAALVHGAVLWTLHLPPVYAATLQQAGPHLLGLVLLLGSSWWFWRSTLWATPGERGPAMLALLGTMAHTGLLGALLVFAGQPLYPVQAGGARAWGLEPLDDQQLAGLLMWVAGGLGYLQAAAGLALRWFSADAPPLVRQRPQPLP